MAVYDGFFDAVLDESTFEYDREYNSDDFTGYFGELIGSGVCVHENENSMLVGFDGKSAVVAPGYLFIRGYWLKNTENYNIQIPTSGTYAILATLNTGDRRIELGYTEKAEPEKYEDALVLAYVTIAPDGSASVEDTRHRTDICGVINSAGSLSKKVEFAINYIDNEIDGKLAEADALILEQSTMLDKKVEEVNAMVEKMAPPPIGTVKFSASSAIEDGWLRCDGRFISEADYPELVAALGKKYPSGDKFTVLSAGEIGTKPTNMVIYGGFGWVYSYTDKALYGVDLSGTGDTRRISFTSSHPVFERLIAPTSVAPLCLSIVEHKVGTGARLFLSQILRDGIGYGEAEAVNDVTDAMAILSADFTGEESSLDLICPLETVKNTKKTSISPIYYQYPKFFQVCIPFVVSQNDNGVETYYCMYGGGQNSNSTSPFVGHALSWQDGGTQAISFLNNMGGYMYGENEGVWKSSRYGFSTKNLGETVGFYPGSPTTSPSTIEINSGPDGMFRYTSAVKLNNVPTIDSSAMCVSVAGHTGLVFVGGLHTLGMLDKANQTSKVVSTGISLPSAARLFYDGGGYLWGKDIYIIFVGTGLLFFRTLDGTGIGYLDTTDVMGTITQFGDLEYSQNENELYLIGQDTNNRVVVAKMVLNTLFDYANDGAWLPMIASDGVPAYIKALEV